MSINILSDLIITKVYTVSTVYSETGKKAIRKDRNRWAIIHKFEGETLYTSKGKKYLSNRNNLVILPKGCDYEWVCMEAGHFSTVEFESPLTSDEILYFTDINGDRIQARLKTMETKRNLGGPFCELETVKEIYSIILSLLSGVKKKYLPSHKGEKLEPATVYIAENFTKSITNDLLAELCGLSTVYFRKLFTEVYGMPPIGYIKELKISKAKEMLKSDFGSITDIALSLGYQSIYDFSRDFKKRTGLSPKEFFKRKDT